MDARWYLRRLASMSPAEIGWRVRDRALQQLWKRRRPTSPQPISGGTVRIEPLPSLALDVSTVAELIELADELIEGRWPLFGQMRNDLTAQVDYHCDPKTGVVAPSTGFFSTVPHRDEEIVGNVKFVWEAARHQHLTVLGAAFHLTGDERYALRIVEELDHFRRTTTFPEGIHWTSGIEIGIRLISWVWLRRLLATWTEAPDHFERNADFVSSVGEHQLWLATFPSRGSSANNHAIAELCGMYAASTAFPFFTESAGWREHARQSLIAEFDRQTFSDGLNVEVASDYHIFVLELVVAAWCEGVAADDASLLAGLEPVFARAFDALASVVDGSGAIHSQGDSDDAFGLLLDVPRALRTADLLEIGSFVVGRQVWWPQLGPGGVRAKAIESLSGTRAPVRNTGDRRDHFPDAGLTFLRSETGSGDHIWARFDHGPLGYLSTAAHGHADALSVEARIEGVRILIDPGTYCYHGQPEWRNYFRSTRAHNTVEIGGEDQSQMAGPFLWSRHAETTLRHLDRTVVAAEHDGYVDAFGVTHHRALELDGGCLTIRDTLNHTGTEAVAGAISFHLGDDVALATHDAELADDDTELMLRWQSRAGDARSGLLTLDPVAHWSILRGSTDPIGGWWSPNFGTKLPTTTLVGHFDVSRTVQLVTILDLSGQRHTGVDRHGGTEPSHGEHA